MQEVVIYPLEPLTVADDTMKRTECAHQVSLGITEESLKRLPFPVTQMSAVYLKN